MRDRFELNCKTVGLVFLCIGAYYALTAVPLFFHKEPDVTEIFPRSMFQGLTQSDIADIRAASANLWKYALRTLVLTGIAPMLTGLYLMRSNNLFVRLCYPTRGANLTPPPSISTTVAELDAAPKAGNADERKPESKYAPPGYFE
jgi:hypothetical protein